MTIDSLSRDYDLICEKSLQHRYITNISIEPMLKQLPSLFKVDVIGTSVKGQNIYSITFGNGPKKLLLWSQMHGNESTTTKALFDVFNFFKQPSEISRQLQENCTYKVIAILSPDGAEAYTRVNANEVDLNRDAQNQTQPESKVLKNCFEGFQPDYCYNLHGQRTIFSAGASDNSAIVSFLSPSQDEERSLTSNRKVAMEIIAEMNKHLQTVIPNQVGIYDDSFNINCVGDTFQHLGVPTILFEAGHYPDDYAREETRKLIYYALILSFQYIANNDIKGDNYEPYFTIPENQKLFHDIIIRDALVNGKICDVCVQYEERLEGLSVKFTPKIERFSKQGELHAHKAYNANKQRVLTAENTELQEGSEIDFVFIENHKISLIM
ncbi:M14 family zinc carboxypeptidase [Mangrovimonas sp. DI 80]|uniref:M14 family zinc carboxypeptidase n=1 Tax=Mangrovimonas sp. DI 80 TaxID=1779330 RepID=UPI0009789D8F|nr:M14 family zinc carboxypeptidase [Mangrovimonas sp. DI 80]OMP30670.1 peptidase M14 [Mangrovimonas sp. DI 80]